MRLSYSDKDIIKSYMGNATEEQIEILAELNSCYKSDIVHLLQTYGINKQNSRKRVYVNRTICKEVNTDAEIKAMNDKMIDYVRGRRLRLEFLCLSDPKIQKRYFDEMQLLMEFMDEYNKKEIPK